MEKPTRSLVTRLLPTKNTRVSTEMFFFAKDISKVVSTHLWNTPLNLYQRAIKGFLS